ncbi:MAG TPA: hypothetical protein VGS19_28660 [Streptosporangiaceae bacterium]|nr:hypothetical protein [Streptosporangiaceae bacterium]
MRWKPTWAAAALAVGTAVVTAAALTPAQAAASGWRVEDTFSGRHLQDMQAIDASSASNAWVMGLVPAPELLFVIQRWDGSRWVDVPVRLPSFAIGLSSGIYTSSPKDTWFFPLIQSPHFGEVQDAVHWDGSKWTTTTVTTDPAAVIGAADFSASDVWAFGEKRAVVAGGYGPALVRHWNGKTWQTVSVPVGSPVTIDGVSPHDIWALGISAATLSTSHQTMIAMRWDGTKWSGLNLPRFRPVRRGYPWVASAVSAAGPNDAWVAETPRVNIQNGYSPPGVILLHWDGSTWHTVAKDATLQSVGNLAPDGHGGFWLSASDPTHPRSASDIIDYRDGTFTSQPAPAVRGYRGSVTGIAGVPGSATSWAWGQLNPDNGGSYQGDISRYTP